MFFLGFSRIIRDVFSGISMNFQLYEIDLHLEELREMVVQKCRCVSSECIFVVENLNEIGFMMIAPILVYAFDSIRMELLDETISIFIWL